MNCIPSLRIEIMPVYDIDEPENYELWHHRSPRVPSPRERLLEEWRQAWGALTDARADLKAALARVPRVRAGGHPSHMRELADEIRELREVINDIWQRITNLKNAPGAPAAWRGLAR